MVAINFREAPEAQAIAEDLIADIKDHEHLQRAKLLVLFTNQKRKKCDRIRLGSAAKMSALQRFLASGMEDASQGQDFLIIVDEVEWRRLDHAGRRALMDHELSHCSESVKYNKRGQVTKRWWSLRGHDVEEFRAVLARHGFWKNDLQQFGKTAAAKAQQLALPDEAHAAVPERELAGVR